MTDRRILKLRLELYAAAQTLKGDGLKAFTDLIREIAMTLDLELSPAAKDREDRRMSNANANAKLAAAETELRIRSESLARATAEVERLRLLINTPRTEEFFEAVRIEAAHQIDRWGVEHDAGKRSEDWVTLLIYLLGKAARAHFDGERAKLEHHVITSAAVALNWWRHLTGASTAMRPGIAG